MSSWLCSFWGTILLVIIVIIIVLVKFRIPNKIFIHLLHLDLGTFDVLAMTPLQARIRGMKRDSTVRNFYYINTEDWNNWPNGIRIYRTNGSSMIKGSQPTMVLPMKGPSGWGIFIERSRQNWENRITCNNDE